MNAWSAPFAFPWTSRTQPPKIFRLPTPTATFDKGGILQTDSSPLTAAGQRSSPKMSQTFGSKRSAKHTLIPCQNNAQKNATLMAKHKLYGSKWAEFCRTTDLHGYKYIVMRGLSTYERCCWAVAVALCMVSAAYLVATAWHWYSRNPTVTVIETTHGAIWDVPFPAVTICDLNMVSKRAARRLSENLTMTDNVTREDVFGFLRFTPLFTSSYRVSEQARSNLTALQAVLDYNNVTIEELFRSLNPSSCNRLVQRCMWKNTIYRCDILFRPILTHYTACCTFNYFAVELPSDYSNSNDPFRPKTPRRVASCGYQSALTVLISIDPEDYYSTAFASYGAVVYVDNAYNVPDKNSPLRLVNPQTEVFVAVSPERTYATKGISSFPVGVRECLFKYEQKVGIMKAYSYHNCMIYKKTMDFARMCGCIPHYLPKNDTIRSCNFRDLACLQTVQDSLFENIRENGAGTNGIRKNFCLPDCEHYAYPLEVAVGHLARHSPLNGLAFFKDVELRNHSLVNVFFNDLVSTRFRRDVYLNWQNLLASFGGLLGLLLGFTLISGVDIVIFIIFRLLYGNLPMRTSVPKSGDLIKINEAYPKKIDFGHSRNKVEQRPDKHAKQVWSGNEATDRTKLRREFRGKPPNYEDVLKY